MKKGKTVSMESMKAFIRREGSKFLRDSNVTSIGVGYKVKNNKPTKEICIQFTVEKKVAPEALEGVNTSALPKFITIDGVEIPTDVLPRKYQHGAREVRIEAKIEAASLRKSAVDPVVPGVSIGHPSTTAGTCGCVVYDARSGNPYVLSNWHVLCGDTGKIGDPIVQPGPHDDNRVQKNIVGRLVRSHLGVAGDCAIASIDQRKLADEILDLKTSLRRIGEPDLGDKVIKSGRTTDVTYGIVNRIHTLLQLDYGTAGMQEISCFEIAPDPDHPAPKGEISMGGDSGSAWMQCENGKATDMILGLHFAGEVGDAPEHAMACYPGSVFEKLEIVPLPTATILGEQSDTGYAANFLGIKVAIPEYADEDTRQDALEVKGRSMFDYTHFSLAMSSSQRFARWVAWNIDGGAIRKLNRNGLRFRKDPKIPSGAQFGNEIYSNNSLDRGHIARRADLLWGSLEEAQKANSDSFFYTNITPQHEAFNQSSANGIWGELENALFAEVDIEDLKVSVMGGAIFSDADPVYRNARLPRQFWKILYFLESGDPQLKAKGYVLTQADLLNRLEVLELPEFSVYEVPISQIGEMTGLTFTAGNPFPGVGGRRRPETAVESVEVPVRRIGSIAEIIH